MNNNNFYVYEGGVADLEIGDNPFYNSIRVFYKYEGNIEELEVPSREIPSSLETAEGCLD